MGTEIIHDINDNNDNIIAATAQTTKTKGGVRIGDGSQDFLQRPSPLHPGQAGHLEIHHILVSTMYIVYRMYM